MSQNYTAALIGCGRMGATIDDEVADRPDSALWIPYSHAAGYAAVKRTELIAVSDVDEQKATVIGDRYGAAAAYTDYREMIEKESPDIVSIATRPATHKEITVFAARNGVRAIYCEKPLCCSMEEADEMVSACTEYSVKFNYGTQRRYMPLYRRVRELVSDGALGTIDCVIGHCGASAAQWGHTHTADMLQFLAGDEKVAFVQGTVVAEEDDWDGKRLLTDPAVSSGYIQFANGIHAYIVAGAGFEFEISGSLGKIRTLNNGKLAQWRKVTKPWNTLEDSEIPEIPLESGTVHGIEDIVAALDSDGETMGGVRLAARSQEMIFGLVESHRRGGTRVAMPLPDRDLYIGRADW